MFARLTNLGIIAEYTVDAVLRNTLRDFLIFFSHSIRIVVVTSTSIGWKTRAVLTAFTRKWLRCSDKDYVMAHQVRVALWNENTRI